MIVSIIAAMAEGNRGIGFRGALPWKLPADMEHFRSVTMGHCLIMGRKTHESIGRPLPGRKTIILTRKGLQASDDFGVQVAASMRDALRIAEIEHKATEAFIAGGGEVYETALDANVIDRMLLTIVHAPVEADVFFPYFEAQAWTERWAVYYPADVENDHSFTITMLEKDERAVQGSSASSLEKNE